MNRLLNPQNPYIRQLDSLIDLSRFTCGDYAIDQWARRKAKKFHSNGRQKIYCFADRDSSFAKGVMAVSLGHYDSVHFPKRKDQDDFIPEVFPAIYIDYIGVQRSEQRRNIGSTLLIHALRISYEVHKSVPLYAVALRSLNSDTTRLYAKFGFVELPKSGNPLLMVLPIWSVIDLFG